MTPSKRAQRKSTGAFSEHEQAEYHDKVD